MLHEFIAGLPANASKSATEPGSVARISSVPSAGTSLCAFAP